MPSGYLSVFLRRRSKICLSVFGCCEQGYGTLNFLYVKATKALIAPQAAKQKGEKTSSVQELQRGAQETSSTFHV